jgi:hypothetical protein
MQIAPRYGDVGNTVSNIAQAIILEDISKRPAYEILTHVILVVRHITRQVDMIDPDFARLLYEIFSHRKLQSRSPTWIPIASPALARTM